MKIFTKIKNKIMNTPIEKINREVYTELLTASPEQLEQAILETIEVMKAKSAFYDWEMDVCVEQILTSVKDIINNESQNRRKVMCRSIKRANLKKTMGCFNYMMYGIKVDGKIKLSKKERGIQSKRKIWKELQAKAEIALNEYKEEKGDYYKLRLQK